MTVATIQLTSKQVTFHETAAEGHTFAEKNDALYVGRPADLQELSGPQLVEIFNMTADLLNAEGGHHYDHTKRFATKDAGTARIMANITDLYELRRDKAKTAPAPKAPKTPKVKAEGSAPTRRGTGINLDPKATIYPCREGSKQALLVDMLSREQGATMAELIDAMSGGSKPWQEVTVKSGLNWDMNKVKGYGIRTSKRGDVDCYHLVLPVGMSAPLAHTPRKTSAGE